jgi:hypothetical protein
MIERLMNLDRRIIYVFVFMGVLLPLLFEFSFPIKVTYTVRAVHREIERVADEGEGVVLLSFSYGPGAEPELQPMALALLRHCFSRDVKVVAICLWPDAPGLAQQALNTTADEFGKTYGVDYAFMGYKPGMQSVVINMGQDFHSAFPKDVGGTSADSLALTRGLRTLKDFDFVCDFAAGNSIDEVWIPYGQEKYRFPLGAGCTAVMAPDLFPYLQSKQLVGFIGGLAGAAEYETLIGHPGMATTGMSSQSATHIIIIAFIALGNIVYFSSRRSSRTGAPPEGGRQ